MAAVNKTRNFSKFDFGAFLLHTRKEEGQEFVRQIVFMLIADVLLPGKGEQVQQAQGPLSCLQRHSRLDTGRAS